MAGLTEEQIDQKMQEVLSGDKSVEDALTLEPENSGDEALQKEVDGAGEVKAGEAETPDNQENATDNKELDDKADQKSDDDEPDKQDKQEEEAPVVLAKDGEHTLPFSVVEGLRNQVAELQEKLKKTDISNAAKVELEQIPEYSKDDLELVKEDMPELATAMEKLISEREALAGKVAELSEKVMTVEEQNKANEAQSIQDAIDAVPKLAHIQATNEELWNEAVKLDNILAERPENSDLSLQERFEKALRGVEAMFGEISIPGADNPEVKADGDNAERKPDAKPEDKADNKSTTPEPQTPNSLSDLPAGAMHDHNPLSALGAKSPVAIMENFNGKTPEQIETMIAQLI